MTAPEPTGASAPSLLILDDDDMVGLLLETVGRMAGMTTRRAFGHEAFHAALMADPPTHVVIDLTLPGMPGEVVLRELAALGCTARVIVCSGAEPERLSAAAALAASLGLACAGILPKPFSPAELRRLLAAR